MFSIVVPLVEKHDGYIHKLFKTLVIEQEMISEIIIARSRLHNNRVAQFERIVRNFALDVGLKCNLKIVNAENKQNAAQNRNQGGDEARSEWICFIDADDDYSEFRLRYLSLIIQRYPTTNLILHSYTYKTEILKYSMPMSLQESEYQVDQEVQEILVNKNAINSNLTLQKENIGLNRIHHGHITVKNEIFQKTKFQIDQIGQEDGLFCNDVLNEHGSVRYLPIPLSIYNVDRSVTNKSTFQKILAKFLSFPRT